MKLRSLIRIAGGKRGRRITALMAVAALSGMSLAACGSNQTASEAGDTITLRITSPLPRGAGHMEGMHWWASEVEKRSDGRIKIEEHYGGSLMGAIDTLSALEQGRVDAGYMSGAYWQAEMPLWSVDGLPFITEDGYAQAIAFYELYQNNEDFRAEWERNGVKLMIAPVATVAVTGVSTPVESLDDLDGMRLRVVGYVADAFSEIGVEPVAIPPDEQYEAIQRGVLDGFGSLMFDAIPFFGLHEVAPHLVYTGVGQYGSVALGLSLKTWDSTPPELQELMTEVAEEYMYEIEPAQAEKFDDQACEQLLAEGGTVSVIDEDEVNAWEAEVGDTAVNGWKGAAAAGENLDEAAVEAFFEEYKAIIEENEDSAYTLGVERCAERSQ